MINRDILIDQVKGAAIILVILGHVLTKISGYSDIFVFRLIYSFHMPVFFFLSGYVMFNKLQQTSSQVLWDLFRKFFLVYFIWRTIFYLKVNPSYIFDSFYVYFKDGILHPDPWFLHVLYFCCHSYFVILWVGKFKGLNLKKFGLLLTSTGIVGLALSKNLGEFGQLIYYFRYYIAYTWFMYLGLYFIPKLKNKPPNVYKVIILLFLTSVPVVLYSDQPIDFPKYFLFTGFTGSLGLVELVKVISSNLHILSKVLQKCGIISLELYLVHGLISPISIGQDFILISTGLIFTLVCIYYLIIIFRIIIKFLQIEFIYHLLFGRPIYKP